MHQALKILRFLFLAVFFQQANAGEKTAYQNWVADLGGKTVEAYTIADPNTSFGIFCSSDQCLFYLHQGLNCSPGMKYSVLMNSASVSTAITMECALINGNTFQILTPFNAVLQAIQSGEIIGFAVALQSGAFAVARFNLSGAKAAVERVLFEASANKQREQKEQIQTVPPVIQIFPQIQIVPTPQTAPNQEQRPKISPNKSSKDIST
jgi:hypothetical protein